MKTVYMANNGKLFNTEEECLDYESGATKYYTDILNDEEKIMMYYDDGSRILSTKSFCNLDEMLEYIDKIFFSTSEAVTAFTQLFPFANIDKNIELKTPYVYNHFLDKFIKEADLFEVKNFYYGLSNYLSPDNTFYNIIKLYLSDTLNLED